LQIRLIDGTVVKATMAPTDTLQKLAKTSFPHAHASVLITSFPKKSFPKSEWSKTTLQDAGLVPSGTLMLSK